MFGFHCYLPSVQKVIVGELRVLREATYRVPMEKAQHRIKFAEQDCPHPRARLLRHTAHRLGEDLDFVRKSRANEKWPNSVLGRIFTRKAGTAAVEKDRRSGSPPTARAPPPFGSVEGFWTEDISEKCHGHCEFGSRSPYRT